MNRVFLGQVMTGIPVVSWDGLVSDIHQSEGVTHSKRRRSIKPNICFILDYRMLGLRQVTTVRSSCMSLHGWKHPHTKIYKADPLFTHSLDEDVEVF